MNWADVEETGTIAIRLSDTVFTDNAIPNGIVGANASIKVRTVANTKFSKKMGF